MVLLNYSSQSLNICAHHILASWNLYVWNHDTIYQVPATETSTTKATVCIVDDCIGSVWFPLLSLQLLIKTWKGLYSIHITPLINKCAGAASLRVLIIARRSVGVWAGAGFTHCQRHESCTTNISLSWICWLLCQSPTLHRPFPPHLNIFKYDEWRMRKAKC